MSNAIHFFKICDTLSTSELYSLMRWRETQNALQLSVFLSFFLFFLSNLSETSNCKSLFLILKISQYGGSGRWVLLFSRYPCKIWHKNWYLHFYKTYDHQIWQTGASAGLDSNETNQAGAGDAITARSRDKLKALYLHYQSTYGHQTRQDGNLSWWAPVHKITWPLDQVVKLKWSDHVTN